ncbi:DNA primase family protein [Aerococcus mictus]|uniref:DNA primase family protein n=1 Tax=Aerococcus mictus TaxID=2976810 RepID=UPI0018A6D719|nr:phage/plasmid primase, P4 family [Aerococcus mictus]
MQKNASFIYSTFSHRNDWHRFRVVFFLDKPLTTPKQSEMLYRWLMDKFPNADKANKDASRIFFGGRESIEIDVNIQLDTSQVTFEKQKDPPEVQDPRPTVKVTPLANDEAIKIFKEYLDRERLNLQDYDHALSVIWVLARAAKTGEISFPVAYQCADLLAMDNVDWQEGNQEKLQEAVQTPLADMHTQYTFAGKFAGQFTNAELDKSDIIATAKFLVQELEIKWFKNKLYFKSNDHWISDNNKLLRAIVQYVELKNAQDNELIHQFQKYAEFINEEHFPIIFKNNYYFKNGKAYPGEYKEFTPYYLDVNYEPTAYSSDVDEFLNFLTCDRQDLRQVVEEILGHVLMDKGFPHKVFFFIGEKGANGKSTFLEMLNAFAGDLGTNISLENFNDPTSVVELEGHLVTIGDDIDARYLERSSNFKILASGNTLMVRPIYSTPYRMKNKAPLIFTANDMPTFKDKTGGIARRLVIIPCDNVVKKVDFSIDEKLSTDEAKSYLLNLALEGLNRLQVNGGKFSESETINNLVKGYLVESNTILQFIDDVGINPDLPDTAVYKEYRDYCDAIGSKPFTKTSFTQELQREGYEQKRMMRLGKRAKYYVKVEEM